MGGRGSSSGMSGGGGGASVNETPNQYASANEATQAFHEQQVNTLKGDDYPDYTTYNLQTLTKKEYSDGYQFTFCQIGDNYTAQEYADKVNEFLSVSSDGITSAGKFQGTPEVSFHCSNRAVAIAFAKKYNQISIWDWKNQVEIETGGTGRR